MVSDNIKTNIEGIKLNDYNLDYHIDLLIRNTIEEREKELMKLFDEKLDWIKKEINNQPTDRSINHLKNQILGYIIPQVESELSEVQER